MRINVMVDENVWCLLKSQQSSACKHASLCNVLLRSMFALVIFGIFTVIEQQNCFFIAIFMLFHCFFIAISASTLSCQKFTKIEYVV